MFSGSMERDGKDRNLPLVGAIKFKKFCSHSILIISVKLANNLERKISIKVSFFLVERCWQWYLKQQNKTAALNWLPNFLGDWKEFEALQNWIFAKLSRTVEFRINYFKKKKKHSSLDFPLKRFFVVFP